MASMDIDSGSGGSLLDRISGIERKARGGSGRRSVARASSAPYDKNARRGADPDGPWKHDKFAEHEGIQGGSLGARLNHAVGSRKADFSGVQKALGLVKRPASDSGSFSIRGASKAESTTLKVTGLASGTTSDDVQAIFKSCGHIVEHKLLSPPDSDSPVVLVKFQTRKGAVDAQQKFNGQPADGRTLVVEFHVAEPLGDRLGMESGGSSEPRSVDVLLESSSNTGKLYSDAILATDPRAQQVTTPPTFGKAPRRGQGARGGNRGNRGNRGGVRKGRGLQERMDMD